ncbi:MAG: autotransporter-associated beta strand repeat-containing protein [Tepidisphaeraceae bacterium]
MQRSNTSGSTRFGTFNWGRSSAVALAAATIAATLPTHSMAANKAWSTTPANGNFSGVNWTVGNVATTPPTDAAVSLDALFFGTSSITALTNDLTGASFAGLTFNSGAAAFTVGGNDFTLGGNITNNSAALQTITNNLTLDAARAVAGTGAVTLNGTISGAFAFNKTTNGTLTLNGANSTFSGGTTIGAANGATVVRANATQALGTGAIGIAGNGATNRLELAGGISLSNNFTLSGRTAATTGDAIRNVSGDNTLSGLITFTSGGNFYNLQSDSGTLAVTNTGTLTFQDANRVLTFQGAGNGLFATTLAGAGSVSKTGTGTWTLTGANTFTGSTTVTGGTLTATGAIGTGALTVSNTNTAAGTAVTLNLPTATATSVGALSGTLATPTSGTNTATINNGGQNLTVNQGTTASTYAGTIAGAGGLTVTGTTGTLTFGGANTYTGATTVNGGTLAFGNTGNIAGSTGLTVASGASVRLSNTAINTVNVNGPLTLGGATLSFDVGNGSADSLATVGTASVSGTNTINITSLNNITTGNYTLISAAGGLGGASFVLGTTPSIFGSFSLAASTATAEILTVTSNAAAAVEYWSGKASTTLGDTGSYKWSFGSNVGTASNWSTNAAGTTDALQVPLSNTLAVFTATNATPNSGTTLATQIVQGYSIRGLSFDTSTNANGINAVTVDINGQSLSTGTAGLTLETANTSDVTISGTGSVVFNGSQSWANNSAKLLTVSSAIAGNATTGNMNTTSIVGSGSGNVVLSGVISDGTNGGTQAVVINKTGSGTLNLSAANTFTGGTTLTSGTVVLSGTGTIGAATNALTVNGGTLDLGGTNKTVGNFGGTGGTIVSNGAANSVLTVGSGGTANTSYAGVIANTNNASAGVLGLTKTGTGTLALTGANTFGGVVSINAGGTLSVSSINSVVGGTASSNLAPRLLPPSARSTWAAPAGRARCSIPARARPPTESSPSPAAPQGPTTASSTRAAAACCGSPVVSPLPLAFPTRWYSRDRPPVTVRSTASLSTIPPPTPPA